ncbi:MAG: ATPase P [Candidatus Schekmanbacteria bacterium GWA2_38_11]|uniref:ATPase P n=1 Tax=Candidatus Schekmanbacteria bacterium GWA2_38_11 TaxID=1817876 RepID=A0A1F7R924_9BACT|nr:MAG: ATPase P [Candidatus Schekmanbacteria bacterium GWA2_38_11]
MLEIDIPGFGLVRLEHAVFDFTGTLSLDGRLLSGVREQLNKIAGFLKVHVLTSDTFGMAEAELMGINYEVHIFKGDNHDIQKAEYVKALGAESVVAIGNGNNDRGMLKIARIGIAVCLREGCSTDAVKSADVLVTSTVDALDLLLNPKRCKATLRF